VKSQVKRRSRIASRDVAARFISSFSEGGDAAARTREACCVPVEEVFFDEGIPGSLPEYMTERTDDLVKDRKLEEGLPI